MAATNRTKNDMLTQNNRFRRYLHAFGVPAAAVLLIVFLQIAGLENNLRYDRQAVLGGEIWRLFSGNLVHLGWPHVWLNVAGLALIWLLFGALLSPSVWLFHIAWTSLAVGLGLLCFDPNLSWYVGLSGVLHGLFVAGLLAEYKTQRSFAVLVFAIFSAKLVWEQVYGPLPGSERAAGGNVVVNAHLYGAIGGMLGYVLGEALRKAGVTRRFASRNRGL